MWRFRSVAALGVIAGVLIFGATVVYGGWFWNSQIDVEGVDVRPEWTVVGDNDGANDYTAKIRVDLPEGAEASIMSTSANEQVSLGVNDSLRCRVDGIEAQVTYHVEGAADADGKKVKATVTADGKVVGVAMGGLGSDVSLNVLIPTSGKVC